MIALTRVDSRLIHGQVTVGYSRRYGVDVIVIANDYLANSTFEKNLLKMAAPTGVEIEIISIDEATAELKTDQWEDHQVLLLVKSPIDLLELINKGVVFEKINVGGVINEGSSIKLTKEVIATDDEMEAWKKIDDEGVKMELQWDVSKNVSNFNEIINKHK